MQDRSSKAVGQERCGSKMSLSSMRLVVETGRYLRWTESTQPLEVRRDPNELLESRRLEERFQVVMETE